LAFKNKSLISVIEDVVESIRVKGVYTSTFDGTYTTCTTVNEFKPREVIFINGKAYSIIEATVSYFTVKGNVTAYNSFTSGLPYFLYGHILEISNILKEKNKGIGTLKWQKYPLIILQLDVESKYEGISNSFSYSDITIYICNLTEPTYRASDRLTESFDKVLYPIYEKFITALLRHPAIVPNQTVDNTSHTKVDRFYWGSQDNNNSTANIFDDYLDAIEIKKLELNIINYKNC
jgi:hypothetical protein